MAAASQTLGVPTCFATVSLGLGTSTSALAISIDHLASDEHELARKKEEVGISPCQSDAHIEIVGAGPGDPDLISVRGRRMLERADLILYAGSLVPKSLTECHKPGAVVRSSADMNLEEQCALMKVDGEIDGIYIKQENT